MPFAAMKNPLDSLPGTIACGILLTVVLYLLVRNLMQA
jgi:hypothetical protein